MKNKRLKELFVKSNGFTKEEGFAINTQEMNPEDFDEIFFSGKTLEKAIEDYQRAAVWYAYQPSDMVQLFEELDDAVEYVEESGISFADFVKAHKKTKGDKE